jgi:hypothetical protein
MHKKQRNRQRDILFVLISSFIVVVAWVSFNIYHIWITSTIPNTITPQLEPINPQFDATVRQQLKSREQIDPLYDKQSTTTNQTKDTVTPTPESVTTASGSSQLAPTSGSTGGLQGQ